MDRSWPTGDIVRSGTLVATGTDWPALAPTPDPWPGPALDLATVLPLYTLDAAESLGLKDVTGSLAIDKSPR